jgi:hypothetical protein
MKLLTVILDDKNSNYRPHVGGAIIFPRPLLISIDQLLKTQPFLELKSSSDMKIPVSHFHALLQRVVIESVQE